MTNDGNSVSFRRILLIKAIGGLMYHESRNKMKCSSENIIVFWMNRIITFYFSFALIYFYIWVRLWGCFMLWMFGDSRGKPLVCPRHPLNISLHSSGLFSYRHTNCNFSVHSISKEAMLNMSHCRHFWVDSGSNVSANGRRFIFFMTPVFYWCENHLWVKRLTSLLHFPRYSIKYHYRSVKYLWQEKV
jgi:hypothetical protein